ncbi:hypothetical protein Taro_029902 [Colocasia esculenta]|uniref:AP2/ERF domain-containing protein n=1 Tax=Colocasia esculenta TaxID=4460 RepID=A0A843VUK1_COLES|nr:hypothetical protein [Colocasia esculenta]
MNSEHSTSSSNSSSSAEFSQALPPPGVSSPTSSWASSSTSTPKKKRAGRKKFRETRHPVYRGVRERNGGKWVCEVREPSNKARIWLGTYVAPEMAARAHDVAALALRGKAAPLNFPDSAWLLPRAASASAEDIRCAAARAADMFRPRTAADAATAPSPAAASTRRVAVPKEAPAAAKGNQRAPAPPTRTPAVEAFLDDEALFDMPGLVAGMAEGLMLTPPSTHRGFDWDDLDCHVDTSLWNH